MDVHLNNAHIEGEDFQCKDFINCIYVDKAIENCILHQQTHTKLNENASCDDQSTKQSFEMYLETNKGS